MQCSIISTCTRRYFFSYDKKILDKGIFFVLSGACAWLHALHMIWILNYVLPNFYINSRFLFQNICEKQIISCILPMTNHIV